jgi:glycosyltransferase involved in cell wall biosynthesis
MTAHPEHDVVFYIPSVTSRLDGSREPAAGGAETQTVLLARALAQRGASVAVVAYPSDSVPLSFDGVDVIHRRPSRANKRLVGKLHEAFAVHGALRKARARVVVVQVAGLQVGLAAISARLRRQRFVYQSASFLDFDFSRRWLRRRDLALYRLGLRLATDIVVQTEEQARACQAVVGRVPQVVRSIAEPAPERRLPGSTFLWPGRVDANKRPLEFVELARALPDCSFTMVAVPSPAAPRLMDDVRSAAANVENLKLLGPIPRGEVVKLAERAVAVVNTSEWEGLPNTFLEGWARGVPALALAHDPDGVIVRYGLGEFAAGSHERLVEAARRLWDEREDSHELATRCRDYVRSVHAEELVASDWEGVLDIRPRRASHILAASKVVRS